MKKEKSVKSNEILFSFVLAANISFMQQIAISPPLAATVFFLGR